jgi:transposase
MIRVHLPDLEVQALEELFRTTDDRQLRDRTPVVLMAHRGRPRQDIAAGLGRAPRSVPRWLNSDLERGRDGLRPRKAKGAVPKIPDSLADTIRDGVRGGPAKQGLDRANGTHEEWADHLLKQKGIRVSRSAMGRFCRKLSIRVYRPTYRYLRGDTAKQAQAKLDLADREKEQRRAKSSSGARTRRGSRWCPRGRRRGG